MNTSVGTKAEKKQPSLSVKPSPAAPPAKLKTALLALENACMRILDGDYASAADDPDRLYWQQRLMNIAKPVSLALAECSGPRHFHGHYRHRKDDASVLQPVLEDPIEALAQVCEHALIACRNQLAGMQEDALLRKERMLENALRGILQSHELFK